MQFTHVSDLATEHSIPEQGTLSRALINDDTVKVVWFGFAAGEELSEHTASMPAIMHFVQGEAVVTLGEQALEAHAGTWIHMEANLRHSIRANSPLIMILTLLKNTPRPATVSP